MEIQAAAQDSGRKVRLEATSAFDTVALHPEESIGRFVEHLMNMNLRTL